MTSANTSSLESRYRNSNALRMAGDLAAAEAEFRSILECEPAHRDATYSLAFMLREQGRTSAAAFVVATWWQSANSSADEALAAIGFVIECADFAKADTIARDAHAHWPADARIAARAGEIALALGAFDRAAGLLREALDRNPAQAMAWLRLAHCKRFESAADDDLRRFEGGWKNAVLDPMAHTCAGFALGKALDDLGEYDHVAQVLRPANAAARNSTRWNSQDWQRLLDIRNRLPQLASDADFVPVFVVGMPRTGTTLVTDMLAKYSDVRDRGELNWVSAMHAHLREQNQFGDRRALATVADLIKRQMRRDDAPARFYVDKNPLNFRYLGLIAALFPQAKIIHCTRGKRDTALSLWMQHFAHEDMGFAYDFASIAQAQDLEATLMQHWRDELDLEFFGAEYEAFVADPLDAQRRLAAFLNIASPSNQSIRTNAITTASVWQARQPVYTRSVGRWRKYAPYLPELTTLFSD